MKKLLFFTISCLALTGCFTTKPMRSITDDKVIFVIPKPKNCNVLRTKRLLHPRFYRNCINLQKKSKVFIKKYNELYTHHEAPNYELFKLYNESVKDCEAKRAKTKAKEAKRGYIYDPEGDSCSDSIKNDPFLRYFRIKLIHQGFGPRLA